MFRIPSKSGSGGAAAINDWVRPVDWMPLPDITAEPNTITALVFVGPVENRLEFTIGGGDISIDWGDGVIEPFGDGTVKDNLAVHTYDYNTIADNGYNGVPGFKQVAVKITSSPGFDILSFVYDQNRNIYTGDCSELVEMIYHTPELTNFTHDSSYRLEAVKLLSSHKLIDLVWSFTNCHSLQYVDLIDTSYIADFHQTFAFCKNLKQHNINGVSTESGTSFDGTFRATPITAIPEWFILNPGSVDDPALRPRVTNTFKDCALLKSIDGPDWSLVGNGYYTFSGCNSLQGEIELYLPHADQLDGLFQETGISKLTLDVPKGYSFSYLTTGCTYLTELIISSWSPTDVVTGHYMIQDCRSLKVFSFDFFNAWRSYSLDGVVYGTPNFFFRAVRDLRYSGVIPDVFTSARNMFDGCHMSLVPLVETGHITDFYGMFYNARNTVEIPAYDLSNGTSLVNMFNYAISVTRIYAYGFNADFSVNYTLLDAAGLEILFNNLADRTALTTKSVTITGVPGVAALTQAQRDIALNKNWTIVE